MNWKHFTLSEFSCRHCGENRMEERFISRLDHLRDLCGFPLVVTSGYRCPEHNQRVSTTGPNGPHTTGRASDIAVRGESAVILLGHALGLGFTGFGIQQKGPSRFIHLDDLPRDSYPRPTIWSY